MKKNVTFDLHTAQSLESLAKAIGENANDTLNAIVTFALIEAADETQFKKIRMTARILKELD